MKMPEQRRHPYVQNPSKLHFCMGYVVALFDILKICKSIRKHLSMGGSLFASDKCRLKLQDRSDLAETNGDFTGRFDLITYYGNNEDCMGRWIA